MNHSYTSLLKEKANLSMPHFLPLNVMFEGMTGSVAYGVSNDTSDMDIVGFCIPPKDLIFPHLRGEIPGFGTQTQRFEQFQVHHVSVPEYKKTFDITIFSIVKFFHLTMENNPNMVDVLFLPRRCVLTSTAMYEHVRNNRKMFLHKGAYHKFRGYAYSQLAKIKNKTNSSNPKRAEAIEKFGFDTKFAYHLIRLLLEVEQILVYHDLVLDNNVEILKAIRNGEMSLEKIIQMFEAKEKQLEELYHKSSLQYSPNEAQIKNLLMECIEMHYGSISQSFVKDNGKEALLADLKQLITRYE